MMSARVITPPSMDINRDMSQNCPDSGNPAVVAIPSESAGEAHGPGGPAALPEVPPITTSSLGCPSPAISPNSSASMLMGPTTELILSTRIVPRCLFGPPDPLTADFARQKVKEIREQDKRRYNFDFDEEVPLEGPFKWEAVPVAPSNTTSSSTSTTGTGSSFAPRAYALSRLPYLSGSVSSSYHQIVDRGMVSPPLSRTTRLSPAPRQLYYEPDRDSLLIARTTEDYSATSTSSAMSRPISSTRSSSTFSPVSSSIQSSTSSHHVVDPTMVLPSPEASSCSSEDSAHMEMELEEEEEVDSSEESAGVLTESQTVASGGVMEKEETSTSAKIIHHSSSTSSGLSSRVCSSSSRSSTSSTTSSRRTKSVSSSSSSPSASPSSPSSSQPPITRYFSQRKRPASTTTSKAAENESVGEPEKKRAAF